MVLLNSQRATACPNCGNPIPLQVEQIFDVAVDPTAKRRLLSGQANVLSCGQCRFQTMVATPLAYHDPEKELLLTYVPMELNLPAVEKEKALGSLVRAITNRLAATDRKGYLLRPQEMLTLQGMFERILEADGITPEMLKAQQTKAQAVQDLLKRMLSAAPEQLPELVRANDTLVDYEFFAFLANIADRAQEMGDAKALQKLQDAQEALLAHSTFGQFAQNQNQKMRQVSQELEALGDSLDQAKLLERYVSAPDIETASLYISLAIQLVDYEFFSALTERIDQATGAERQRLEALREHALELSEEMLSQNQAQAQERVDLLQRLVNADDIPQAVQQALPYVDELFMAILSQNLQNAQKSGAAELSKRLQQVAGAIQQAVKSNLPPEIQFINELLSQSDSSVAQGMVRRRATEFSDELGTVMEQVSASLRERGRVEQANQLDQYRDVFKREKMMAKWR